MPVREYVPTRPSEFGALVNELVAEWKNPSQNFEPEILLERDRERRIVHVYVVWSKWSGVDQILRSEIIMDAAAQVLPENELLNIIVAMGLTSDEAERLRIIGAATGSNSGQRP